MKQNLFYLLLFINGLAIGWLLVSTLASLGSTKQNVLNAMRPQSFDSTKLESCKTKQVMMHKTLGPICIRLDIGVI